MKQETKKVSLKALGFLLAIVLLLGGTVGGSLAWIFDQTQTVKNTFVAGDINITLKEHVLDADGKHADPEAYTDTGLQRIMLVPGRRIEKDPTVTVLKGSQDCYVRVLLKITWGPAADPVFAKQAYNSWFAAAPGWTLIQLLDGSYATNKQYVGQDIYELRYNGVVSADTEDVKLPVFTSITIPMDLSASDIAALGECTVELVAQAIQYKGFAGPDEAWAEAELPMTIPVIPPLPEDNNENP